MLLLILVAGFVMFQTTGNFGFMKESLPCDVLPWESGKKKSIQLPFVTSLMWFDALCQQHNIFLRCLLLCNETRGLRTRVSGLGWSHGQSYPSLKLLSKVQLRSVNWAGAWNLASRKTSILVFDMGLIQRHHFTFIYFIFSFFYHLSSKVLSVMYIVSPLLLSSQQPCEVSKADR